MNPETTPDDDLLTATEAAELTGRRLSLICDWVRERRLCQAGEKRSRNNAVCRAYRRGDVLRLDAAADRAPHEKGEPTLAELDALIAEQMRNLPRWWVREAKAARAFDIDHTLRRIFGPPRERSDRHRTGGDQ